jgi:hypothetical protein
MSKNKIYDYVVVLKNPKLYLIQNTGWLLSILSLIILSVNLFITPNSWLLYLCSFIILVLLISNFIDKKNKKEIRFKSILITAGIGLLFLTEFEYMNLIILLAGLTEGFFLHKTEIGFTANEVVIAKLWKEKIGWKDLNNVIIKDGTLTLDFKNNRLIQSPTDDAEDDEYDVDDDEFNAYCRNQLKAANP